MKVDMLKKHVYFSYVQSRSFFISELCLKHHVPVILIPYDRVELVVREGKAYFSGSPSIKGSLANIPEGRDVELFILAHREGVQYKGEVSRIMHMGIEIKVICPDG